MSSDAATGEVLVLPTGNTGAPTKAHEDVGEPSRDDRLPARIGRYVVLEVVGIGGMGVVCTAYDPKLDRKIALKLLRQRDRDDARRRTTGAERLQREARALAKLKHPNVVAVHDVDIVDNRLYIAMEFIDGESVLEWIEREPRPWRKVVDVFIQAARGLAAAHDAEIIHRDFKPANMRLEPGGRVVVLDFGLALESRSAHSSDDVAPPEEVPVPEHQRRLTAVGRRVGTPAYMAPEQILGHQVGPATDQFAFGVSLYEALYGVLPFRGNAQESMWAAIDGNVAPPPKDREVPAWLHRVVLRLLSREPAQRYADMAAVITALSQERVYRRRFRVLAGGAAGLAAALGLTGWALSRDAVCPGATARIEAVWSSAQAEALRAGFIDTGLPYAAHAASRTSTILDDYASAWSSAHVEICAATRVRGEQSDALLDHRMDCLDARLVELDALVGVVTEADANLVEHAVDAALRLPQPDECRQARPQQGEQPPSEVEAGRVAAINERLARVTALADAGRAVAAHVLAGEVWRDAEPLQHGPTRVKARILKARTLEGRGDAESADAEYVAAIREAAQHGLLEAEATGWIHHLQLLGNQLRRPADALELRLATEAAVLRSGDPIELHAHLAHALGVVMNATGDFAAAAEHFRVAIAERTQLYGADDPRIAGARSDLGIALVRLGQADAAEAEFRQALEAAERSLGADHPLVANFALNLGNAVAEGREDFDAAAALYERARAIREAIHGPHHASVAEVLVAQGVLARSRGDHRGALPAFERALASFGGVDTSDPRAGSTLNNLAISHLALGELEAAETALGHSVALFERSGLPKHPSRMRAFLRRCEVRLRTGDRAGARGDCQAAQAILDSLASPSPGDTRELAGLRGQLDATVDAAR